MKTAAAAQSSSTTATSTSSTFLVLRDNPNGSSTALLRSTPFGHNNCPTDFGALVMLIGLLNYSDRERIEKRKKYLDSAQLIKREKRFSDYDVFTSHGGGVFKISYAVWTHILDFLIYDNTIQCIPFVIAPEYYGNSIGRATDLAYRIANTAASYTAAIITPTFFQKKYKAELEFACFLDAALNADQAMVEKILTEASPANRQTFLSTAGKATITHLGIERTGTPLQMALYSHDEKMVEVIKLYMDQAEFQRQCDAVFGPDYNEFLAKQQTEATRLCGELEPAFKAASALDVTNALNHVANTTSALQDTLNRFKANLERYVSQNAVHNPYILPAIPAFK